jgi:hypothetical protein
MEGQGTIASMVEPKPIAWMEGQGAIASTGDGGTTSSKEAIKTTTSTGDGGTTSSKEAIKTTTSGAVVDAIFSCYDRGQESIGFMTSTLPRIV